ncbi:MAG: ferrous iron transport protein B [Candidatus Omnitrophica bacterium]|nr:ferrous iron transport protein B [Candidatus Omnitrophota bacterium]MCB9748086.1 ferrous iron transport protein B [Candidatus Omnitrophota bacterium]
MSKDPVLQPTVSLKKNLTIALAGNPNCGKTTVFNALTKLRQKVGNYPGVTVEKKTGRLELSRGRNLQVVDLPGTYSLSVRTPDEEVAREVLLGRSRGTPRPDLVVCVVDAGNLERNLYLVTQIQDLGLPIIVALNMMDEVKSQGRQIDVKKLSELLGVPVVSMIANQNKGIDDLKSLLEQEIKADYTRRWRMSPLLEEDLEAMVQVLIDKGGLTRPEAFFESLMLLSSAAHIPDKAYAQHHHIMFSKEVIDELNQINARLVRQGVRARSAAIEARYEWIKFIVKEAVIDTLAKAKNWTHKIDTVLTHKVWGWVSFIGLMTFMFYMIFTIATYPMDWIDSTFSHLGAVVEQSMPEGDLRDLIINGIIPGVGGVIIFLPQILILFFFIGLLQDTGYMARAAFIMDRVMNKVGLHGKSFIPLLSSFACAIPGVMAARTIESPKDRLVTILVAPLMSCSARLPVYTIMIAVLIPQASAWQKSGIMLIMYLLGIIAACTMGWIFKKTLLKGQKPTFILELPPYRLPSFKSVILQMWERSRLFLKRAGTIILTLSIVLWALMSFPRQDNVEPAEALRQSYAGKIGQTIEPVIKPLGYDWRIGIGLVGSFAAREVFVSTMNIVFNLDEEAEETTLRQAFKQAHWPDGRPLFTPLVCISLMIFYVFALQCISTVAIVLRETNSWRWTLFQLLYMTVLAYVAALAVYQIGKILGFT